MKKIFFIAMLAIIGLSNSVKAQWISNINLGCCEIIDCFTMSGNNLYAGDFGGGVLLDSNNAYTIHQRNTGLTNTYVTALAVEGSYIFAGTGSGSVGLGMYMSTNDGCNWTAVNNGLTNKYITALTVKGDTIFAGINVNGIYKSSISGGINWISANTSMTNTLNVLSFAIKGDTVLAGTNKGIFFLTNYGDSWDSLNFGFKHKIINSLAVNGSKIYAGTYQGGAYLSSNNGATWDSINTGLPAKTTISAFAVIGDTIFAGTSISGVYLSTNHGSTWTAWNTDLSLYTKNNDDIDALIISKDTLFAGTGEVIVKRALSDITVDVKGINNIERDISIYPNPSTGKFQASSPMFQIQNVEVYNVLGEKIYCSLITDYYRSLITVDMSKVTDGIYFIHIKTSEGAVMKKIVISK